MQFVVDLCLIVLFTFFIRQARGTKKEGEPSAVAKLAETMEPVLQEAQMVAKQFEQQLQEKQRLVRRLNERLDSRIISLNLLLNRAEAYVASGDNAVPSGDVCDLQQEILRLAEQGLDGDKIAARLGVSKGEVNLVLDLKKKFVEMEES